MSTIFYETGTSLSAYMSNVFLEFTNDIGKKSNVIKINFEHKLSSILADSPFETSDNEIKILGGSRLPPLEDIPYSKNIRCPKDLNIIIPKERRNKKRILNNDRDITPFSKYYQN